MKLTLYVQLYFYRYSLRVCLCVLVCVHWQCCVVMYRDNLLWRLGR